MSLVEKGRFFLRIKSSLGKTLLIVLPHSAVFVLLLFLAFKNERFDNYLLLIFLLIISSLVYFYRLHLSRTLSKSIFEISMDSKNCWRILLSDAVKKDVVVSGSSFDSNFLIILNFEDMEEKYYVALITADSVTNEEFRKLKVFLKTQKLGRADE